MDLIDKPKVKPLLSPLSDNRDEGLLTMETDYLQNLELEDIHMKIANGTLGQDNKKEINDEILSMPDRIKLGKK